MKLSEQVDQLLPALDAVRRAVEIKKTKTGHKCKYADLGSVMDASDPALKEQGLFVIQTLDDTVAQSDQVLIITRVYHAESGQWIENRLAMLSANRDPQGLGSAITYGRRYSLLTVLGLAPEDDDAQAAMPVQKPAPVRKPQAVPKGEPAPMEIKAQIFRLVKDSGIPFDAISGITGLPSVKECEDAHKLTNALEALKYHVSQAG